MSPKTRRPAFRAMGSVSVAAALALFSLPGNPERRAWELSLTLRVEGVYRATVAGATSDGDYALALAWSGTMEEDDDDYRLVQRKVRLIDWRANETTTAPGVRALVTTMDFPETPAFDHVYVLKEKTFFHVEFALSGFAVPVHESEEKLLLDMPRTAESRAIESAVVYNAHVRRGSNIIRLPAALISETPLERRFGWSWQHRQSSSGRESVLSLSHSHRVDVAVRLQSARPKADPAAARIPRRAAAAFAP